MKKLLITIFIFSLHTASALDYGQLYESVDKQKAADSVDSGKMMNAVSSEGIDYQKAYDSVDKGKVVDAVDMQKAGTALIKE